MVEDVFSSLLNFFVGFFESMSHAEKIAILAIFFSALVLIILERIFPYSKNQELIRDGFFEDFALYTIAQNYVLSILIFGFIIKYFDSFSGLSQIQLFKNIPIWIQLIFFTVSHDFYIYWMHRFQHKNKWLWRIHEAHHSPKKVDWLSGSRSHSIEILINQTVEFAPIILLGSPTEVIAYKGIISAVWGMYIHSNIDVDSGRLQYFINGPEMHRWHHSTGKGRNRNFSTKFAMWDWIFRTSYFPANQKVVEYGLKTFFPKNYFKQFTFAFRSFKKQPLN